MAFDTEKFIKGLHEYLERAFKPVSARINTLNRELDELKKEVRALRDGEVAKSIARALKADNDE